MSITTAIDLIIYTFITHIVTTITTYEFNTFFTSSNFTSIAFKSTFFTE